MNILIVRLSSIGDIVHTLPAATQLKSGFERCRITWVTEPPAADLLESYPDVDRVIVFDKKALLNTSAPGAALRALRRFWAVLRHERYDLVLDFQGLLKSGLIAGFARGRRTVGFAGAREGSRLFYSEAAPPQDFNRHALERHLGLVRFLGLALRAPEFNNMYGAEAEAAVAAVLSGLSLPQGAPLVCVHPAARWPTKCWPSERVAELCRRLVHETGCRALLVGSDEDRALHARICNDAGPGTCSLAGTLSLPELACLFARASLAVTVDSGPMHLACAVDTPLVALMGPTAPWRTGPFGHAAETLFRELPCSPCYARVRCPEAHHRCMRDITVDEVLKVCCNVLQQRKTCKPH